MSDIKSDELAEKLTKKGFVFQRSTNHDYYVFYFEGKPTSVRTKISHGRAYSLRNPLKKATSKQLHITTRELEQFVECSFTNDKLIERLISDGTLKRCS